MEALGATVVDGCDIPTYDEFVAREDELDALKDREFKHGIEKYLNGREGGKLLTFEDIVR